MRCFILALTLLLIPSVAPAKPVSVDQITGPQPVLGALTWLADPQGKYNIETIASGELQEKFIPLTNGFPVKSAGPVWLRLLLVKSPPSLSTAKPASTDARLVLQLGETPPGKTTAFLPAATGPLSGFKAWAIEDVAPGEQVYLPEPGLQSTSIYIRMDETPGLWFSPKISPYSMLSPSFLPLDLLLPGLIILALLGCLLRSFTDWTQWPLWSSFFLICVLIQVILPLPLLSAGFALPNLPTLLGPGMALLLLPHVGRVLLRTKEFAPVSDRILSAYPLIGICVCLLPLLPDYTWLTRLFPLWPLLLFPLLPLCIHALAKKHPGSLAFSGVCALSILGACFALLAAGSPTGHTLAKNAAIWGLAVGGVGLALARPCKTAAQPSIQAKAGALAFHMPAPVKDTSPAKSIPLLLGGPSLSHTPTAKLEPLPPIQTAPTASPEPQAEDALHTELAEPCLSLYANDEVDPTLIEPQNVLPVLPTPDAEVFPLEPMLVTATHTTQTQVISLADDSTFSEADSCYTEQPQVGEATHEDSGLFVFSLPELVRKVHDVVAPVAKSKGLFFSWYMTPTLPPLLEGDAPRLHQALSLLLQNAVQATQTGAVQLYIRPCPTAAMPDAQSCALLFSISDNGAAQRTDAGFFHAWDLAERTGGAFTVEYTTTGGTIISFSTTFALPAQHIIEDFHHAPATEGTHAAEPTLPLYTTQAETAQPVPFFQQAQENTAPSLPCHPVSEGIIRVLAAGMTSANRLLLTSALAGISHEYLAAKKPSEIPILYLEARPHLLVFDASAPEADIALAIAALRDQEQQFQVTPIPILALCGNDSQAKRLLSMGCTQTMAAPVAIEGLANLLALAFAAPKQDADTLPPIAQVTAPPIADNSLKHHQSLFLQEDTQSVPAEQANTTDLPDQNLELTPQKTTDSTPWFQESTPLPEHTQALPEHLAKADPTVNTHEEDTLPPPFAFPRKITVGKIEKKSLPQPGSEAITPEAEPKSLRKQPQIVKIGSALNTHITPVPPPSHDFSKDTLLATSATQESPAAPEQAASVLLGLKAEDVTPPVAEEHDIPLLNYIVTEEENTEQASPVPTPEPQGQEPPPPASAQHAFTAGLSQPLDEGTPPTQVPMPVDVFPLSGIEGGECIEITMLPLLPGLVHSLRDTLAEIEQSSEKGQTILVQEAVNRLAGKAETFGLHKLGKLSRCLERAAAADDLDAVLTLRGDLIEATNRYLTSLQDTYTAYLGING